jgi:hypothetical protein
MLRLLQEKAAGARAHFQPYIAALPPSFDALPLFWSKEERAELEGAAGLLPEVVSTEKELAATHAALMAAGACASISPGSAPASPGRYSHSDTTLYISSVILPTKYTGWCQNDVNVYA